MTIGNLEQYFLAASKHSGANAGWTDMGGGATFRNRNDGWRNGSEGIMHKRGQLVIGVKHLASQHEICTMTNK